MAVQSRSANCNEERFESVVPLNEIAIDLQRKEVQKEVGEVAVEKGTDYDSPEFVVGDKPGVVLVLEEVE